MPHVIFFLFPVSKIIHRILAVGMLLCAIIQCRFTSNTVLNSFQIIFRIMFKKKFGYFE